MVCPEQWAVVILQDPSRDGPPHAGHNQLGHSNHHWDDACNFVISNGGAQTYHLKASCEVERQRWITALELAKAKAARMQAESERTASLYFNYQQTTLGMTLAIICAGGTWTRRRLTEFRGPVCSQNTRQQGGGSQHLNDLISKHGSALQRSLSELDSLRLTGEAGDKIRQVTERATLFRITSNAMINACRDFLTLAQAHSKRWQKALQAEREQRVRLEETLEQLAKQHNHLERAFRGAAQANATADNKSAAGPGKGEASDEDDDNEFFDAMEEAPEFITVPADPQFHKRSSSNISGFNSEMCSDDQSLNEEPLAMNQESPSQELVPLKKRRTRIPDKPNYSLNLWSIMKNCIGKELSKIPMPVNFNEPISMLQRLSEDLEYHELLDKASKCQSSLEQMCYVAAFSVSSYSTTVYRTGKPFNPCWERRTSWTAGERAATALSASRHNSRNLRKGQQSLHVEKVTTTVHNIIVGKLWIDQSGEIDVVNHTTGDRCHLKFAPYSYFSRDVARKVTGVVMDKDGKAHYVLSGTWDEKMEFSRVMQSSRGGENGTEGKQKTVYQTLKAREVWRRNPLPDGAETMYYFTALALTLNEPEEGVAPTDSRRRPDQRLMEDGRWDEANAEKQRLEEKQRSARREREREAASQRTSSQSEEGAPHDNYQALWFDRCEDQITVQQARKASLMEVDEVVCLPRLSRVAVCGGTHGNELSGVYLVRELLKAEQKGRKKEEEEVEEEEESVSVQFVLSNPRAMQQCRRYIDTDLNRCFTHASLNGAASDADPYEMIRSRELNAMLGPKGSPKAVDLVCDLHNTTANMGLCLIAYSDCDWICLHIFKHLQARNQINSLCPIWQMPDIPIRYIHFDVPSRESYSLDSVGKHGFAIEIGPQPHGVVRSNIYTAMKVGVQHMLDWVRVFNSGTIFEGGFVDVFTMVKNIDYPRDSETRNITAAIHPQLQDRDFCLLHPEDALFQTFSGETLRYKGNEPLYPFFVNECAYYEKGIALSLARKKHVMIPSIRVQTEQEQQVDKQGFSSEEEE
ncbi:hypothetical protein INR49_000772 [Caranx melampygus]|nr:hypothetical protein INR49_000772 [Caranx melampygus]